MCTEGEPEAFPYEHFCNFFPQMSPEKSTNTAEFLYACGDRAAMYLSNYQSTWLNGKRRLYAHCLLTAHIVYLTNRELTEGDIGVGPVTSSSVGGVSVSMQTPQSGDSPFEWWLNKSQYGQEFLALVRTRGPFMATIGSRNPVLPLR